MEPGGLTTTRGHCAQMKTLDDRTLQVPALGRPFNLGMLYDCRDDSVVTGMTLWDPEDLKKDRTTQATHNNEFEIVTSESLEDKSSALNVNTSLKASILCGMVEVGGSAKYLKDKKTSTNQARVTLKYNATTRFEELSMRHLSRENVKHPEVFDKGIATHVVTGVVYGAQAFFVFDREISKTENKQEVQVGLKAMVKNIPQVSVRGNVDVDGSKEIINNDDKFSCKFYGDFHLEKPPVSFTDAIDTYQSLPKLLGANGENAVPVEVWLLPLRVLDSSAAKLVRQISQRLVNDAQNVLENLYELEIRCNDALKTTTVQNFPQIGKKIKSFKKLCSDYRMDFQKVLVKKLPAIRGGGEEETDLAEILRKSCPFSSENLNQWMDSKEREIQFLKFYTKEVKNTRVVQPGRGLDEEMLGAEKTVCFVFTSLGGPDPYLDSLEKYLNKANVSEFHKPEIEQWFLSDDVAKETRRRYELFRDFAEANEDNKNMRFLMMGSTDEEHTDTSIYLYEGASLTNKNFEPTPRPEKICVSDTDYNNVRVKVSAPECGCAGVSSHRVEFCVKGEDKWHQVSAPGAGEVVLKELTPNTEYRVRVRAETAVGLSAACETADTIKTLPCSAPGKPQVEATSSEISVKCAKPAKLGDVHVLKYVVEYAQADNEQELKWSQCPAADVDVVIPDLQSDTKYAVRVHCDCGVSGRSKDSDTVYITTTSPKEERIAESLKLNSTKMKSDSGPSLYKLTLIGEDRDVYGCRFYNFGNESTRQNRTIMILGASGSGKTTLINRMVNYISGVQWKDDFRFKLVHEKHESSEVCVYKINHQEGFQIPFSLTVVDTPGFGYAGGVQRDEEISENIRTLVSSSGGISSIDAVCVVTQASLAPLTLSKRYVFDLVLSIFGKDLAENILMLVTFADGKRPPVLEAINSWKVPCPKNELDFPVHFQFNNSVLFAENREDEGLDERFWQKGSTNMQKFFNNLSKMETKSLNMTKEVYKERRRLKELQSEIKEKSELLQEIKKRMEKNPGCEIC